MDGRIVVVQEKIPVNSIMALGPQVWAFSPNSVLQSHEQIAVGSSCDCLALLQKLLQNHAFTVKKVVTIVAVWVLACKAF